MVVAHPDDIEYGAAAAVARWTGQGKQIAYCLVTSGEAGMDALPPAEAGPLREQEERRAAAIVGVDEVEFLGHPDGTVEYGLALRRDIAGAIRRHRPDIVITANFRDSFGPGMLNQADHIATGRAVLDAARDAGNRWVFPDGAEPWNRVQAVWAAGSPEAGHGGRHHRHLRPRHRLAAGPRGVPGRARRASGRRRVPRRMGPDGR